MRYWATLVFSTLCYGQAVEFNRDIRPLLSDRCFACHASDAASRKIKLRLDIEESARGAATSGELVRRITEPNVARRMPPPYSGVKLSNGEIDTLRRWVEQGAPWQKHWSLLPPVAPPLPAVRKESWPRNGIDRFVLARLEREGIEPSPEAPRASLLRRVTLDLTGVPPTPSETAAFLADTRSDAYDRVVDRLLASPRYGEKMAIRWLDAARYADTNGYQTDAERQMWRWRDWVIEAFNSNKPYDVFATEQLAGDLLPNATLDQKIATGFNRNHRGNSEGGIVPEEYLVEYAVDRVETFSTVFLGSTLGCARCHNHKYDPFTQREFYQLFAYFNNIPELGRYLKYGNTPPHVTAPTQQQQTKLAELDATLAAAADRFKKHEAGIAKALREWRPSSDWAVTDGLAVDRDLASDCHFDGKRFVDGGDAGNYGFYSKFTAAAWITPETKNGPIVTRARMDDDGDGWGLYLENGKLQANLIKRRLDDSIRVETAEPLAPGRHHAAMTYDGSRVATGVQIYVDGEPQKVNVILDAINQDFAVKEPLRIGAGGGMGRFQGEITGVRVYSRALAPLEVSMLAVPRTLADIAASPANAAEKAKLREAYLETAAPQAVREAYQAMKQARTQRAAYVESLPTVMIMQEQAEPKPTHILLRGAYDHPGEPVTRGVPAVFPPLPEGVPNNRLALAKWLTDPKHPLTARVAINRIWQMYFGTGIVKTVEDFGSQGEWPSHPELLDWLATEFVRSGWDIKALHKLIVTSATYRQSSAVRQDLVTRDPENRLLARAPRMRLPAEVVRDQALFVSGLLVEKLGGPSVKPYQPAGLWSELGDKDYERDHGENLYRRSLYTFWKRTAPPPFMANFDSAMRESCTVREARTNTPLQALNLMNDVTFLEAARVLAQKTLQHQDETGRLPLLFRTVLTRDPSEKEVAKLRAALAKYKARFEADAAAATDLLSHGDAPVASNLSKSELSAWTMLASLVLNLDETVTKE